MCVRATRTAVMSVRLISSDIELIYGWWGTVVVLMLMCCASYVCIGRAEYYIALSYRNMDGYRLWSVLIDFSVWGMGC